MKNSTTRRVAAAAGIAAVSAVALSSMGAGAAAAGALPGGFTTQTLADGTKADYWIVSGPADWPWLRPCSALSALHTWPWPWPLAAGWRRLTDG